MNYDVARRPVTDEHSLNVSLLAISGLRPAGRLGSAPEKTLLSKTMQPYLTALQSCNRCDHCDKRLFIRRTQAVALHAYTPYGNVI